MLVLVNKYTLLKTCRGALDILGFDAIHKIIEDHIEGAIPIMAITVMDDFRKCHVPFVCLSSHTDANHFVPMLKV